jgi:crossover junction endodeoxyribonuclease RuvC
MRILGIDPGIGRTGWGIIDTESSKLKVKSYGCIETEPNSDISGRLFAVHDEVSRIILEYKPECMAVEELFFGKNIKTAFVVGQARGVILLAGAENNLPITIYTPLQVKIALTGYGRAEKPQVGKMVKTLLNLTEVPKPDDTADALAVALSHAFSYRSYR